MPSFLKKWIKHGIARSGVAIVYLSITFTIPLTHTCNLHKADPRACHSNSTYHSCSFESHTCTQPEFKLKQSSYNIKSGFRDGLCLACVCSMNCRTTEISSEATPFIIEIPVFVQSLSNSKVARQLEWTCSIAQRAPPVSIS